MEELDVGIAARREALPAHAGGEVDDPPRVGVRRRDRRRRRVRAANAGRCLGAVAEHVAHRHPELGDERVERAHRRVHAVELDLRDEARRDADAPCELAQADPALLALLPQPTADLGGLEGAFGGSGRSHVVYRSRRRISATIRSAPGRNASSSGGLYGIGVFGVAMRQASSRSPSALLGHAARAPRRPSRRSAALPRRRRSGSSSRRRRATVSMSSGRSVRRSITSAAIPSAASALGRLERSRGRPSSRRRS